MNLYGFEDACQLRNDGSSWGLLEPLGAETQNRRALNQTRPVQDAQKGRPGRPNRLLRPPQMLEQVPGMHRATKQCACRENLAPVVIAPPEPSKHEVTGCSIIRLKSYKRTYGFRAW